MELMERELHGTVGFRWTQNEEQAEVEIAKDFFVFTQRQ